MSEMESVLGRVVVSRAGRDRGRAFLITGIADDKQVYLADGALRKSTHPKKKKLMHLHIEPVSAESIAAMLKSGMAVQDAEIRKNLLALGYNTEKQK